MAKLTMTTFLTLDGVMQAPGAAGEDRSGGFSHGGWLVPFADADMGQFMTEVFARADAFLLGRRTYEIFAVYWPHITDPNDRITQALNTLPKHVASKTLNGVTWDRFAASPRRRRGGTDAEAGVRARDSGTRQWRTRPNPDPARSRRRVSLTVVPVVLGTGRRLFESGTVPTAFERVTTRTTSTSINTYRPTGRPQYGSFALDDAAKDSR